MILKVVWSLWDTLQKYLEKGHKKNIFFLYRTSQIQPWFFFFFSCHSHSSEVNWQDFLPIHLLGRILGLETYIWRAKTTRRNTTMWERKGKKKQKHNSQGSYMRTRSMTLSYAFCKPHVPWGQNCRPLKLSWTIFSTSALSQNSKVTWLMQG